MIRTIAVTALAAGTIAVTGVAFAGQDKIEFCHNDNNLHPIETSVQAFFNAGHIDHEGDIWPEFTYTENGPDGQEITVPAQGDQAVLANGCQPIVIVESPSPSPSPSDIPSSPPVSVTPSPTPTQHTPSPSVTPTPRETPEPPAPREEETREQVLDCDNLTYTITVTYTVWPVYFDEAQWMWVEGEPEVHVGEPYVVDANPNECESSPTPSRTHTRGTDTPPPTDSSTTSPPASATPTTVPVYELAQTGSDDWKVIVGTGLVLLVLGLIGWRIGRPTTPTHTPTHRL